MMKSRVFSVALPVAALLGLAVSSFAQVALNAPAFSPDLREDSVLGDWRLAQGETHFNKSDYYFQLGYGYLQADTASLLMGNEALPELDLFDAQMQRSQELFNESLSHAPGRAAAWTSLAWASILRDDIPKAEDALRVSWQIAPFNVAEAAERVALISILDDFHRSGWRSDAAAATFISQDWAVLDAHDAAYLSGLPDGLDLLIEDIDG